MKGVLVVDEHKDVLGVYEGMFQNSPYRLYLSDNPRKALNMLKGKGRNLVDLVITDIYMDKMSGDELIRKARHMNEKVKFAIHPGVSEKYAEPLLKKLKEEKIEVGFLSPFFLREDFMALVKSLIGK